MSDRTIDRILAGIFTVFIVASIALGILVVFAILGAAQWAVTPL